MSFASLADLLISGVLGALAVLGLRPEPRPIPVRVERDRFPRR